MRRRRPGLALIEVTSGLRRHALAARTASRGRPGAEQSAHGERQDLQPSWAAMAMSHGTALASRGPAGCAADAERPISGNAPAIAAVDGTSDETCVHPAREQSPARPARGRPSPTSAAAT
ncbi:hypothetical protein ACRAWF_16930 [Streptomyces sp. L7]